MKKNKLNQYLHLFLQNLNKEKNLQSTNILVACSGGVDSMVVLDLMNSKKDFFKFNLEVVFFEHSGSPICEGEEENKKIVENFCQKNEIKFYFQPLELYKTSQKSWEELGRNARRNFYQNKIFDFVFLGHHRDDQNETTLLQLFRGGGRGIAGMKEISGKICRPFLTFDKSDFIDYAKGNNINWLEDPTNQNIEFTRNFLRQDVIPRLQKHYPNFSKIMDNFREKMLDNQEILLDMAVQDGLKNFFAHETIDVSQISSARLKNLFNHIFSENGYYIEQNKLNDFIQKSNKEQCYLDSGDLRIYLYQGKLSKNEIKSINFKRKIK